MISQRKACDVLGISRSSLLQSQTDDLSATALEDRRLLALVVSIFKQHRRRYGSRRIAKELEHRGVVCGRGRVAKLLKIAGLSAIQPRSFKPRSTESRHTLGYNENLLLGRPEPTGINQVWVGDITYISVATEGFWYLAVLMDRHSRMVTGWSLAASTDESLVNDCLRQSIIGRDPPAGLIHHTDRGGQYAAIDYRKILARASVQQSMSRAGDCYDNAFMESCFGAIKTELEMAEYSNSQHARAEIAEYMAYYNNVRLHSSIGYLSPRQFEIHGLAV